MSNPDQQFFGSLLEEMQNSKKDKFKMAFDYALRICHLGRHEPKKEDQGEVVVTRRDAVFAIRMAYSTLEFLSAKAS